MVPNTRLTTRTARLLPALEYINYNSDHYSNYNVRYNDKPVFALCLPTNHNRIDTEVKHLKLRQVVTCQTCAFAPVGVIKKQYGVVICFSLFKQKEVLLTEFW